MHKNCIPTRKVYNIAGHHLSIEFFDTYTNNFEETILFPMALRRLSMILFVVYVRLFLR